ncbi:(2Fe-2S)-binding protein [Rhizorhabdus sp. FW153]|uniref:(2Fe-2S)-binding protein n=1 Tax=Rhizorhabdus sp. FW153 TaxID=3400216 RepID=UPI003CF8B296
MTGRFRRLDETGRARVRMTVDGSEITALEGDTLMVALLDSGLALRSAEFGPERRAGFCLMGACQDCWVRDAQGNSLRACSTMVENGLAISTRPLTADWSVAP